MVELDYKITPPTGAENYEVWSNDQTIHNKDFSDFCPHVWEKILQANWLRHRKEE